MLKYQIFVSSTYDDLKKERDQVIKAILEMGHIPVGMEMFSAADEQQWEIIRRQIDSSDYYIVIVAHRYGSVAEGISFTEKEYDYAIAQGIPVLGFVIDESAPWPADRTESGQREALQRFKGKIMKKPVGFWTGSEDLHGKTSIALMKAITSNPRVGWVRASQVAGPEVMKELTRLSSENAELRKQIQILQDQNQRKEQERRDDTIKILRKNTIKVPVRKKGGQGWEDSKEISLYRLFSIIGPQMYNEMTSSDMSGIICTLVLLS